MDNKMNSSHQAIVLEFSKDMDVEMMYDLLNPIMQDLYENHGYCSIINEINESKIPYLDKLTKNTKQWAKWNKIADKKKKLEEE